MIENRKSDHVYIVSEKDVNAHYNYWNDVHLIHNPMPEIDYDEIDLRADFFSRKMNYPIIIEAMTGGYEGAKIINENIAKVAADLQIGMGVGSERVLLKNKNVENTFSVVKEYDIPVRIANIGAAQLIKQKNEEELSDDDLYYIMDAINAHFLNVHFNFLQEIVQPEGDRNSKGIESRMQRICKNFPIIAKETGAGWDLNSVLRLKRAGILAIDIAGMSGTSFSAVEYYRAKEINDKKGERLGLTFWDWGIPSPASLMKVKDLNIKTIASGGIRHGYDAAKAFALGADLVGIAGHAIKFAKLGYKDLRDEMEMFIEEIKAAMFLTGSKNIDVLKKKKAVITGPLSDWINQL